METLKRGTDPTPEEVELVQVSRDEVDLLLREIHHRLTNTFSIFAALLRRELSRPQNDIERVLARLEDPGARRAAPLSMYRRRNTPADRPVR
jgi:two-component sensor histidine kinase